jgi:hypothetical protein
MKKLPLPPSSGADGRASKCGVFAPAHRLNKNTYKDFNPAAAVLVEMPIDLWPAPTWIHLAMPKKILFY